jgi:hypothetical protein
MAIELNQIAAGAGIFFGVIGAFVYGLKKNGFITFGKPKERRDCPKFCDEHSGVILGIEQNTIALVKVDAKLDIMHKEISDYNGNVREIIGYLRATNDKIKL